jgi:RNA ligase (TIGR02306 family)
VLHPVWVVAKRYNLEEICKSRGVALYGEVYGRVQKLHYGLNSGEVDLVLFDARDLVTNEWLSYDQFTTLCTLYNLPMVPQLYRGPFSLEKAYELAEGPSMIPGADHVREGVVVKPVVERWNPEIQRVILKLHGEGYLTNKNA